MTQYQSCYTSIEAVQRSLRKANPGLTPTMAQQDYAEFINLMHEYIPQFSNWFSRKTHRAFVPYTETITLDRLQLIMYQSYRLNTYHRWELTLPDDMLVDGGITWDGTALSATTYQTYGSGLNTIPYSKVIFYSGDQPTMLADDDDTIQLAGTWGYHTNLSQAYTTVETGKSLATTTATTLNVANVGAYETLQYIRMESELMQITNIVGATSQVETGISITQSANTLTVADGTQYTVGNYIQLESEIMKITAISGNDLTVLRAQLFTDAVAHSSVAVNDYTANLTITRGVNGTTAATHSSVAVEVYNVVDDVRLAVTRGVAWLYENRTTEGVTVAALDGSVISGKLPTTVGTALANYLRYMPKSPSWSV